MPEKYELKQWIWSDVEFENMGWHDCVIHATCFPRGDTFDLVFDIDYILKWIQPIAPSKYFSFWVAPATLVFENVADIKFDFATCNDMEIDSIEREKPSSLTPNYIYRDKEWLWTISCHRGEIVFRSTGYKQFIRSAPVLTNACSLEFDARGAYCFDRVAAGDC
jgi:hypothetical protein